MPRLPSSNTALRLRKAPYANGTTSSKLAFFDMIKRRYGSTSALSGSASSCDRLPCPTRINFAIISTSTIFKQSASLFLFFTCCENLRSFKSISERHDIWPSYWKPLAQIEWCAQRRYDQSESNRLDRLAGTSRQLCKYTSDLHNLPTDRYEPQLSTAIPSS